MARFTTSLLALLALGDAAVALPGKLQRRASEVPTLSPTTFVKGKAFDRIAIIWLENTDYDKAEGDREFRVYHESNVCLLTRFSQPGLARYQGHQAQQLSRGHTPQSAQLLGCHRRRLLWHEVGLCKNLTHARID